MNYDDYIKLLKEEGFTDAQLEIFTHEFYSKYSLAQLELIQKGIKIGVDVNVYANPEFNIEQMLEILTGLDEGIAVEEYAHLDFSYKKMRLIRLCLEKGLDAPKHNISSYKHYSDGELRLIVQCWLQDKSVVSYVKSGKYNIKQLVQITQGILNDVDVSFYDKPEFDAEQMEQVRFGLSDDLDVSIYNNPKLNWKQMAFIRVRLEQLKTDSLYIMKDEERKKYCDVRKQYIKAIAKPYYTERNMEEQLDYLIAINRKLIPLSLSK